MTNHYITRLLLVMLLTMTAIGASAQRKTDKIGRGLVAVPVGESGNSNANYISWRRLAEEYYNVTYNLYKNGAIYKSGLTKPNYYDTENAPANTLYEVSAVINGVEQEKSDTIRPWKQYYSWSNPTGYIDIPLAIVYDRNTPSNDVTAHYSPNDAELADLDGDGDLEIIIKRLNTVDAEGVPTGRILTDTDGNQQEIYNIYPNDSKEFVVIDAYDVNWSTGKASLLWRIDCGPNMVSSNSTEINIIAYDWDEDGAAEVVFRGADNMIVYGSDGKTPLYTIGNMSVNTRANWDSHTLAWKNGKQVITDITSMAYTNSGAEYLIYMNGLTAVPYFNVDYPIARESADAWGYGSGSPTNDSYGHRSSKYFFGAPVFDGRKASLFLARGIYGRHKMKAFDINPSTHALTERWTWECNTPGSAWYGNGYHNYVVADVDEDGRDEIVYGSMVIDDNGNGLSTTGLGHGDAQHVGDFDPYRKGLEFFGCNEDNPAMNYRNATTSEIYYRATATKDDGRGIMDNFTNNYPGSIGRSTATDLISSVTDQVVATAPSGSGSALYWSHLNFRIYWDGDLCSEILDSPGTAREAAIYSPDKGRIFESSGCNMNNASKNNPCFQGDIIGDWREEIIVRCGTNIRVYTSGISTSYDLPTFWHDHEYRQAMVWQMMAYNQPPHPSFFLGEIEGYTVAPPPLSLTDRTEISTGGTIGTDLNGKHVILHGYTNKTATIASGAQPAVITVNAPSWTQGHDNNKNITTTYYTHTLNGTLSGATYLTKQGNGILILGDGEHTHRSRTAVWAGTLATNGTFTGSPLTLHRHTTLSTAGGSFEAGATTEYGSTILIGGDSTDPSTATFNSLNIGYGGRVAFDLGGANAVDNDQLIVGALDLETKTGDVWENYGPEHIKPVFEFAYSSGLSESRYPIGTVQSLPNGVSTTNPELDVDIEGISANREPRVVVENGIIYLVLNDAPIIEAPEIAIVDWVNCDLTATYPSSTLTSYYLPVVGITSGVEGATFSGTFTDLKGNVTNLEASEARTIMTENFETYEGVGNWKSQNAGDNLSLANDAEHGNHISFDFSSTSQNSRSAYWLFDCESMGSSSYTIEFDAYIKPGNNPANSQTELVVMSTKTLPAANSNYGDSNYLFDIKNTNSNSNTFTVNKGTETFSLPSEVWCHYAIKIDPNSLTSSWTITNNSTNTVISSGSSVLPDGTNTTPAGIYMLAARYYPVIKFDNLSIKSAANALDSYTFTKPGTLRMTVSADGYADNMATFTVEHPYVKEGLDNFYVNNYESATDASDWTNGGGTLELVTGDATYGNYIHHTMNGTGIDANRSMYTLFNANYGNVANYTIEFDACIKAGSVENRSGTELVVMSNGARIPTNTNAGWGFNGDATHVMNAPGTNYLFRMTAPNSQVFTINDGDKTVTLNETIWYHYTFSVDVTNSIVTYDISNAGSSAANGTFSVPSSTSCLAQGIFILDGRGRSDIKIDNIKVVPLVTAEYFPVEVNDELCVELPDGIIDGNAHLWRNGLGVSGDNMWATAVLPFDMSSEQVKSVFGENTEVANLLTGMSDAKSVHFETTTDKINANVPFLIRGVTNEPPYLIKGITSSPAVEPKVSTGYFDFIGSYYNQGEVEFTTTDYFFTSAGLRRVAEDGVKMKFKGYRAYFHSTSGSAGNAIETFFDGVTAVNGITREADGPTNVYNVAGQLVRRNATSLDGLPRGVYLVGGKAVVVK